MSGATTFQRIAGMSYLQMAGTATTTVRTCLKQPMKDAALARDTVNYMRKLPRLGRQGRNQGLSSGGVFNEVERLHVSMRGSF